MKLHRTLMVLISAFVEVGLQIEPQISPASTHVSATGSIEITKTVIIGVSILGVLIIISISGLMCLWYKNHKRRQINGVNGVKQREHSMYSTYSTYSMYSTYSTYSTYSMDDGDSEKSIPIEPSPALTHSIKNNLIRIEYANKQIQYKHNKSENVIINRNSNLVMRQFPPAVANINNNNLPEGENKIVNIGSELKDQTSDDGNILSTSISKEERSEVSLTCGESNFGKVGTLSLEHDDNIVCKTNHAYDDSDGLKSHCILSRTSEFKQTFSLNESAGELIQFKVPNDLSHFTPLNDIPLDLPNDIPVELYIDRLTVAGQGTVGLKLRATERFRIILNSNTNQSYGKTNVIALDIGEDATYFRKCNNYNPNDILASTSERKALLDKDMEQLYWFSLDKKNRRLRYGKGPMQSLLSVFCYDFPPQSSQEIDEYDWIENLRYVGISKIIPPKSDSKPKIELVSCRLPVTMDLPPLIIKHEDATLEELETGEATVIENLPRACKELYWNVVGSKITLNTSDFPDFADAIEYSINTPGLTCYKKLEEKAGGFGGSDPKKTYLRVTLGEDRGNSPGVPYVLEIWPSGHYSPIHSHSNSFGIIKVLYNEILARYFTGLNAEDQKWYYEKTFMEGQVTWISDKFYQTHQLWNRTRKVCVTIQCYQYGDENREHYEYFDYLDNSNRVKHFKPNSDWTFAEFKKLIKKEWSRYKYLSGNISNNLLTLNDTDTSHKSHKNLLTSSNDTNTSRQPDKDILTSSNSSR